MSSSLPVTVTGASGFIALHVVKQLLEKGYTVHGTVRSLSNEQKIHPLTKLSAQFPGKLKLFEADLLNSSSFDAAVSGCGAVLHTASPCFTEGVTAENAMEKLVNPALEGTLNVLSAASKAPSVKHVVITSSGVAAIDPAKYVRAYTEEDWNSESKPSDGALGAYSYSKTAAERLAWKFIGSNNGEGVLGQEFEDKITALIAGKQGPNLSFTLATILPALVTGENLNDQVANSEDLNSSSNMIAGLLSGAYPKIPDGHLGIVNVLDVARAHIVAMEKGATGRFFCSSATLSWIEIAEALRRFYPAARIPKEAANPNGNVNKPDFLNDKIRKELGFEFRPASEALKAQADSLVKLGIVKIEA